MLRYKVNKKVSNLSRAEKTMLQNLVDECELVSNKNLEKHINLDEGQKALLFFEDEDLDGFIFFEEQGKIIYVDVVYVEGRSRKKGYAQKMLSFLKKYGKEKGFFRIELVVRKDNMPALKLYEKLGFIISNDIDRETLLLTEFVDDEILNNGKKILAKLKKNNKIGSEQTAEKILKARQNGEIDEETFHKIECYTFSDRRGYLPSNRKAVDSIEFLKNSEKGTLRRALLIMQCFELLKKQDSILASNKEKEKN